MFIRMGVRACCERLRCTVLKKEKNARVARTPINIRYISAASDGVIYLE